MKFSRTFALVMLVALGFAAGCGSGDSAASSTGDSTGAAARSQASTAPAGADQPASTQPAGSPLCASVAPCADFATPSGNIRCFAAALHGGYIECDIASGLRPQPNAPCELDRPGLVLGAAGAASASCRSDPTPAGLDRSIEPLAYGRVWRGFGVHCLSQESGLTCVNADGHGFFLARERWSTF